MRNLKILIITVLSILFFILGVGLRKALSFELNQSKIKLATPFYSYHFKDNQKYNNNNFGLFIFYNVYKNTWLGGGVYRNSFDRTSIFAGGVYEINNWLAVFGGFVNGYKDKIKEKKIYYRYHLCCGYYIDLYKIKRERLKVSKKFHITDDIIVLAGVKVRLIKNLNLIVTPANLTLMFEF